MEELLQNDSVIANVVWELVIRGAFVCYAFLYAVITRNLSKSSAIEDKLDPFAIVMFFIGAFPVLVIVGVYKRISHLIKRRSEKRCFGHRTEGTFVYSLEAPKGELDKYDGTFRVEIEEGSKTFWIEAGTW